MPLSELAKVATTSKGVNAIIKKRLETVNAHISRAIFLSTKKCTECMLEVNQGDPGENLMPQVEKLVDISKLGKALYELAIYGLRKENLQVGAGIEVTEVQLGWFILACKYLDADTCKLELEENPAYTLATETFWNSIQTTGKLLLDVKAVKAVEGSGQVDSELLRKSWLHVPALADASSVLSKVFKRLSEINVVHLQVA